MSDAAVMQSKEDSSYCRAVRSVTKTDGRTQIVGVNVMLKFADVTGGIKGAAELKQRDVRVKSSLELESRDRATVYRSGGVGRRKRQVDE